jgi:hypothetical protein
LLPAMVAVLAGAAPGLHDAGEAAQHQPGWQTAVEIGRRGRAGFLLRTPAPAGGLAR